MARLVAIQGALAGQAVPLEGEVTLGRSPACTFQIVDPDVSRRHAALRETPQGVVVENFSRNGTLVNGERINAPTVLCNRDVVQVAGHALRYEAQAEPAQEPAPSAAAAEPLPPPARPTVVIARAGEREAQVERAVDALAAGRALGRAAAGEEAHANERLRTILRVANAVRAELDPQVLLDRVLDSLFEAFPQADRGFLMLYDEAGALQPAALRTRGGQAEEITISQSIVSRATQERVALLSRDAMDDQRFDAAHSVALYRIRSMMCAPLVAKDRLLGILHLDTRRKDRFFTEDDLELLTGAATQTALALANARMHEELVRKDRMEQDLRIATQVQTSFLPRDLPEVPGMEFAACYRPAHEIGGDFYDFVPLGGRRTAVAVGDVAGKGVPAALLMARISSDLRFYAVQHREPATVLTHLNDRQTSGELNEVFVTLAYLTVDPDAGELHIGNAAHCTPLLRRAAGEVAELGGEPGFPLGVMPAFAYEAARHAIGPGDVVCVVSDGVTEAMNAAEAPYGAHRLRRAIAAAPGRAQSVLDAVLADVQAHVGQTRQSDDLTLVCFSVAGA